MGLWGAQERGTQNGREREEEGECRVVGRAAPAPAPTGARGQSQTGCYMPSGHRVGSGLEGRALWADTRGGQTEGQVQVASGGEEGVIKGLGQAAWPPVTAFLAVAVVSGMK